ncbi:MAG: hypothetical protein V7723_07565 [Sneathiella sp.]|uniref:hypothetical protein n=1 Tax=Sneathiella sp. TaxID=1964365 RepID=UPI003002FAE2
MTTGTKIIERALSEINAHSAVMPAPPESYSVALVKLNSMIATWLKKGIDMGAAQLTVAGDELYEPEDATNGIVYNLAIHCAPSMDNGTTVVSRELRALAIKGENDISDFYQKFNTPKKKTSSTLPRGAGNKTGLWNDPFFPKGHELDG